MPPTRALWYLIAAFYLLLSLAHAQAPVQVPSKRPITGAPPLYQSQADPEIPGRYINFTASGCALSFSAAAVRGLSWNGTCSGGRMQGSGTVIGYDYEQQPVFIFEGHIERGLRANGVMHGVSRKGSQLIGTRTLIVGSALQPESEVPFLNMPRPYLLALDDWSRQTDGKDLLASMGATWAPSSQPAAERKPSGGATSSSPSGGTATGDVLSLVAGALGAAAGGNTAAERRQLALAALSTSGGAAGGTFSTTSVSVLDGLGAPSRFSCMKIDWISEVAPTSNSLGEAYFSSRGPRDSTGRDSHSERKLLVATYVCEEDVVYFAATCEDETMLTAGGGNKQWKEPWVAGELSGVWSNIATGRRMKKGQQLVIADSYVMKSSYQQPNHRTMQPVHVALGVWRWDSLYLQDGVGKTEAGNKLGRRHMAIHLELNRALRSKADMYALSSITANTPAILRTTRPEVRSCKTANIQAVWDSTQ